jgi:hypothetical protein
VNRENNPGIFKIPRLRPAAQLKNRLCDQSFTAKFPVNGITGELLPGTAEKIAANGEYPGIGEGKNEPRLCIRDVCEAETIVA